jgi:hypothetical protein
LLELLLMKRKHPQKEELVAELMKEEEMKATVTNSSEACRDGQA